MALVNSFTFGYLAHMTDVPHVTEKPLLKGEQTCHFFWSQTAAAQRLVPQPGINGWARHSPALLNTLKDWDFCVQILPNGQGPVYLTDLMKCPILCCSSPRSCIALSVLPAAPVCRLLAFLSFDLTASWFKGLSWDKTNCASRREALRAGSALWGGSLQAPTEPDGRGWVVRDERGKGGVTLPLWAAHRLLVQLSYSLKWHPKPWSVQIRCLPWGTDKLDPWSCSEICYSLIKKHRLEKLKFSYDWAPYKERLNLSKFSFERKDRTKKRSKSKYLSPEILEPQSLMTLRQPSSRILPHSRISCAQSLPWQTFLWPLMVTTLP